MNTVASIDITVASATKPQENIPRHIITKDDNDTAWTYRRESRP